VLYVRETVLSVRCTVVLVDQVFGLIVLIETMYGLFEFKRQSKCEEQFHF
jgi:hypothetical protein